MAHGIPSSDDSECGIGEGLLRRAFDAGLRLRTLRVTLDDERDPFADDVIAESVIAILSDLDLLIHDIVEVSRRSSEVR